MRHSLPLALAGAVALVVTGAPAYAAPAYPVAPCSGGPTSYPCVDSYYTPPANLAALANGTIIGTPRAVTLDEAGIAAKSSYTMTYRSTDALGNPVMDAATVLIPDAAYTGTGSTPLVSFQFAEDSLGRQCAPSYALANDGTNAITSAEAPDVESLLAAGYVVVVPDAQGPDEEFIAGRQEGHAVLDGVRAAESFSAAGLSASTPVGLMGYSGGANSTGWGAELAHTYAPELDIVGEVIGGTPADLTATAKYNDGAVSSGLVLFAAIGLDRAYPQLDIYDHLNATGRTDYASASTQCVNGIFTFAGVRLDSITTTPDLVDSPTFQSVLAQNMLGGAPPTFPVFNYHVLTDEIVPYPQDKVLVDTYCAAGVSVDHLELPAGDHVSGEGAGAPAGIAWLADRFAGMKPPSTCAVTNAEPVPPELPTIAAPAPAADLPEAPLALLIPLVGAAAVAVRRRRSLRG